MSYENKEQRKGDILMSIHAPGEFRLGDPRLQALACAIQDV